ncbi:MAG: hypothetical protein KTR31_12345 [Myxococcales bacterium]|nr:hypothetical protein [Myxococcales bacterium]
MGGATYPDHRNCGAFPGLFSLVSMSMFVHQRHDLSLVTVDEAQDASVAEREAHVRSASMYWARARYHGAGAEAHSHCLASARAVLEVDGSDAHALTLAALALVGLGRLQEARGRLEEARAVDADAAHLAFAEGEWHVASADVVDGGVRAESLERAIRAFEISARRAPDAWEPQASVAQALWSWIEQAGGPERMKEVPGRPLLRSAYHAVRAVQLSPPRGVIGDLEFHVARACVHLGRLDDATRILARFGDDPAHRREVPLLTGLVHFERRRFKNAILHLRKFVRGATGASDGDVAALQVRIARAHLELGELSRAQEACRLALQRVPGHLHARCTLGDVQVDAGEHADALRTFKGILADAPDHTPAFRALVDVHVRRGAVPWLQAALKAEVGAFDKVPVSGRTDSGVSPRQATRERIDVLIEALMDAAGEETVFTALDTAFRTSDEGLRFQLWEAALQAMSATRARVAVRQLSTPSEAYSPRAGHDVLALARQLPENLLVAGLQLDEADLRRALAARRAPGVRGRPRRAELDRERRAARAWQALLLLSIACHQNPSSRDLLAQWAQRADPELGDAARAALVMLGDAEAARTLRQREVDDADDLVDAIRAALRGGGEAGVRVAESDELVACACCGRRPESVWVVLVGADTAVCDRCLAGAERSSEVVTDAGVVCALSGRSVHETDRMVRIREVALCREVVDHGLAIKESLLVQRFVEELQ